MKNAESPRNKANILVVDDTHDNLRLLSKLLKEHGYYVRPVSDGKTAIRAVRNMPPDLILLDIMMPGMDGYEVCRRLQEDERTRNIPIIFLSALSDTFDKVKAFSVGGQDFITKPFQESEVIARIGTHLALKRSNEALLQSNNELKLLNNELHEAKRQLETAATTDMLTGLANRRKLLELLTSEMTRFKRSRSAFTLAMADIDHFKQVNDTCGHDCGDFVLKKVAATITESIREQDHVGRWGGEEFLILLPETDLEGGALITERVRQVVESKEFLYENTSVSVTMTFGLVAYSAEGGMDRLIRAADEALYEGKEKSRNCVVIAKQF